jgi:hypothetical protein
VNRARAPSRSCPTGSTSPRSTNTPAS